MKDAMWSLVEGQAYVNFCSCDEGRDRMPAQILKEMNSIYNVSVTFWDLNAQMCGLKQGMNEPIKAYYERMADICVKLEQYHGDSFGPVELSLMKKDCFYVGLKEHIFVPGISHARLGSVQPCPDVERDMGAGGLPLPRKYDPEVT